MAATDPPLKRVEQRRRAVALARHYRDAEGLSIARIAERLGRTPATVKGYLYDPFDDNKGLNWERVAKASAVTCPPRHREEDPSPTDLFFA